jgi:predicted acetyltransferase
MALMALLARPHARFHRSFLDAVDEFHAAGEAQYDGVLVLTPDGDFRGVAFTREGLEEPAEFQRLVDVRLADELPDSPRPPGWAPSTVWWIADPQAPDLFLGAISLRHNIDNVVLRDLRGHIGYAIRPSARRRGLASDALRQVVGHAGRMGLPAVLVTCDADNPASARTIEAAGGVYENQIGVKRRYWIDTGGLGIQLDG